MRAGRDVTRVRVGARLVRSPLRLRVPLAHGPQWLLRYFYLPRLAYSASGASGRVPARHRPTCIATETVCVTLACRVAGPDF